MSTLTEDTISIQNTDNEEEEIIEDDENENEEEDDENNENEDEINENEDENENEEEDNENDNNKGETSYQRPKTSDVWNFVDKETRKYPSCSKIFGKKTGTSSIRTHLKVMEYYLLKKNKQL